MRVRQIRVPGSVFAAAVAQSSRDGSPQRLTVTRQRLNDADEFTAQALASPGDEVADSVMLQFSARPVETAARALERVHGEGWAGAVFLPEPCSAAAGIGFASGREGVNWIDMLRVVEPGHWSISLQSGAVRSGLTRDTVASVRIAVVGGDDVLAEALRCVGARHVVGPIVDTTFAELEGHLLRADPDIVVDALPPGELQAALRAWCSRRLRLVVPAASGKSAARAAAWAVVDALDAGSGAAA